MINLKKINLWLVTNYNNNTIIYTEIPKVSEKSSPISIYYTNKSSMSLYLAGGVFLKTVPNVIYKIHLTKVRNKAVIKTFWLSEIAKDTYILSTSFKFKLGKEVVIRTNNTCDTFSYNYVNTLKFSLKEFNKDRPFCKKCEHLDYCTKLNRNLLNSVNSEKVYLYINERNYL